MAAAAQSPVLFLLVMALATAVSCSCPSAPSITSISPSSATAGSSQVVLTINGNGFLTYSVVSFNGSSLTPAFVNSHQLTATIPAANVAQTGTFQILVLNPPTTGTTTSTIGGTTATTTSSNTCSGNDSNPVSFTVTQ